MTKQDLLQHSEAWERAAGDFHERANMYASGGNEYPKMIAQSELCRGVAQGYRWVASQTAP